MSNHSDIDLRLGFEIVSEPNTRGHWGGRHRRAKRQKAETILRLRSGGRVPPEPPLRVIITRVYSGRSRAFDDDNLTAGAKAVRDAIAEWLGVDDASDLVTYEVRQKKMAKVNNHTRIEIRGS